MTTAGGDLDEVVEAARADDDANWQPRTGRALAEPLPQVNTGLYGARIIGLQHVTVGCICWAKTEGADARADYQGEARGGIVLDIRPAIVDEDGEIIERRTYLVCNPYANWDRSLSTLTETQINPDGCEGITPTLLARTVRRIHEHLAGRKGPLTGADGDLTRACHHLTAIALGART